MRTHLVRPQAPGGYPGIVLCSEIFSVTAPIWRAAALLAGPGFIVAAPAIDHEFEPAATVLPSDQPGADRGNLLQTTPPLAACDADARAVLDFLHNDGYCTGRLGVLASASAAISPSAPRSTPPSSRRPVTPRPIATRAGSAPAWPTTVSNGSPQSPANSS